MSQQTPVDSGNQLKLSSAYHEFPAPIKTSSGGFDFHGKWGAIYYMQNSPEQTEYARDLHARIAREFPEVSAVYNTFDKGPHPTAMFEVNTLTPHQTGALLSWLVVNHGPLDVFVHPNTGDTYRDHAELAMWIGKPWPLYLEMLKHITR
ncbi:DOPA-like domain-containing protein [Chiua virens]|nr:DOPA-like domain-containing protein [Chiua virens]